jgi:hypothetical protein
MVERETKIFGIGFNKTGTTTLESVFRTYGLKVPNQQEQELQITKPTFEGEYGPLTRFVRSFDAFQDMPFSQGETYKIVDSLFPRSKFILTERNPIEWFQSLCRFHERVFGVQEIRQLTPNIIKNFDYIYRGYSYDNISRFLTCGDRERQVIRWDLLYNESYYTEKYLHRNEDIKAYFRHRPEDLLVIDVTKEHNTNSISHFLGLGARNVRMPHENRSLATPAT